MKTIQFEIDQDGIAVLTIDLPHQTMNVLDPIFMEELEASIDRVLSEESIVGAVLTTGKRLYGGADLRMIQDLIANAKTSDVEAVYEGAIRFNRIFRKWLVGIPVLSKGAAFEAYRGCDRAYHSVVALNSHWRAITALRP